MHFNPQFFKVSIIQTKLFGPLDFELSRFHCINVFENALATTVNKFVMNKLVKLKMLWTTGPRCPHILLSVDCISILFYAGMTIEDLDRRLEQGQKISVLGKQYPNTSTNPPSSQYTNLVQVPAASVGRGQNIQVQAAGAGRGQNVQVQAAGVGRGQNVQVQATGVGRGQNTQVQAGGGGRGQAVQVQARGGGRGQAAQVQARGGGRGQAAQVQARGGGRGQAAQVQARGGGRGQVVQVQAGGSGRGQIVEGPAQAVGRGQNTSMPFRGGGKGQRGRGFGRGHKKGAGPQQVNTGHQQGQQPQNPGHLQKKQQGQNQPNVSQGQLKPLTVVRKDNKGGVLQTYNALPTKDAHGKTVFKLKIQDQGVQKNVQTTVMPTRTVVAGSGRGGQGHTERQVIAHNTPQTPRTVVASSNNPRVSKLSQL